MTIQNDCYVNCEKSRRTTEPKRKRKKKDSFSTHKIIHINNRKTYQVNQSYQQYPQAPVHNFS